MKNQLKYYLNLFLLLMSGSLFSQHPASFSWPAAVPEDQEEQGPCHIFAAVGAAESWYRILYDISIDLSEQHVYSPCAGMGGSTSIPGAFNFMKNTGVALDDWIPYGASGCLGQAGSYLATEIDGTNESCGAPTQGCNGGSALSTRYRVGNYQELVMDGFDAEGEEQNELKNALIEKGPIALWFLFDELHLDTNHAYTLIGWNDDSNGKPTWILEDSWPGQAKTNSTDENLIELFHSDPDFAAYYIKPASGKHGVYRETRSGSSWNYNPQSLDCWESDNFEIIGPSILGTISEDYHISHDGSNASLGGIDGATVSWSYEQVSGGAVVINSSSGHTASIKAGGTGTVRIVATITRSNGLCEVVKSGNISVYSTIPFSLNKTYSNCGYMTYSVSSSFSNLTYQWTFYPPSGSGYNATGQGTANYNINLYNVPNSYAVSVKVTSNSLGSQTTKTTGGYASCGYGYKNLNTEGDVESEIENRGAFEFYPNPANEQLTLKLSSGERYVIQIINMSGIAVYSSEIDGGTNTLDVSQLSKGIYLMEIKNINKNEMVSRRLRIN